MQTQTIKSARVGVRVPPDLKKAWNEAATLEGRSLSDIIIAATTEAITGIIYRHRIISFSEADYQIFREDEVVSCLLPPPVEPRVTLYSCGGVPKTM